MTLISAIHRSDLNAVKALLRKGADVNAADDIGLTPLMVAAASDKCDKSMLALLLKNGADISIGARGSKTTAIMFAVGCTEKFLYLLQEGAKIPTATVCKPLPNGCTDEVSAYLRNGNFELSERVSTSFGGGTGPIDDAESCAILCRWNDLRSLELAGADLEVLEYSPLMRAILFEDYGAIKSQLAMSPDLHARDHRHQTPFLLSILTGEVEKAELLHSAGASFDDLGYNDATVVDCAVRSGSLDMLRWLVAKGVDINMSVRGDGNSLIAAIDGDHVDAIRRLVDCGADVLTTDDGGRQAIHFATSAAAVHVLVAAGAVLDVLDGAGSTPLLHAIDRRNLLMVRALVELGADVNFGNFGYTPLHRATSYDDLVTMELLLKHGANPEAEENIYCGFKPGDFAKSEGAKKLLGDT